LHTDLRVVDFDLIIPVRTFENSKFNGELGIMIKSLLVEDSSRAEL